MHFPYFLPSIVQIITLIVVLTAIISVVRLLDWSSSVSSEYDAAVTASVECGFDGSSSKSGNGEFRKNVEVTVLLLIFESEFLLVVLGMLTSAVSSGIDTDIFLIATLAVFSVVEMALVGK